MALQWRPELAIGVATVDAQHQELIARVNRLLAACNAGRGKQEVAALMAFLGEYVQVHFADEEALQRQSAYPAYREHQAQHATFIADYTRLRQQFEQEGATVRFVIQINRIVVDWLVQHISRVDKAFGAYLRAR